MRNYPALEVAWPDAPAEGRLDLLAATLDEAGPVAVEDTPRGARFFFDTAVARDAALALAAAAAPDAVCAAVDVPDEDWAARSQASITRVIVGRIAVCPPWDVPDDTEVAARGLIPVLVQPAMGFGTGHHATTRLCLALLQGVRVDGAGVLDVGTGSGVLALAAWRLGATDVLAIDHDEDALTSARDSAALNGAGAAVRFERRDLEASPPAAPVDVVLANLTGALLARSAPRLAAACAPSGTIILSGVLNHEAADVIDAFADQGWRVAARLDEDEWVGLRMVPTSPSASTTH